MFSDLTLTRNKMADKHIIYCHCGGERIGTEIKETVEKALRDSRAKVTVMSDLCGLAVLQMEKLAGLVAGDDDNFVIGCHKRSMNLIFERVKEAGSIQSAGHLNLLEETSQSAYSKMSEFTATSTGTTEFREIRADSDWPSWYPVIDNTRCTNCGQCADFCLFGVYEKKGSYPEVINPQACKNNCPACARICPSAAIIFPKYIHGGAIGGSGEIDEKAEQERQARDIESILGDDLYEALERRRTRRKSIIREEALQKAMEERDRALGISTKNQ
jgi:Pyruvate/2-oxoacid:ferredoxin oxidoreductase delta subunit